MTRLSRAPPSAVIVTRFLAATRTKPSQVRASCGRKFRCYGWRSSWPPDDNHGGAVRAFIKDVGLAVLSNKLIGIETAPDARVWTFEECVLTQEFNHGN